MTHYEALTNRRVRTKLDHVDRIVENGKLNEAMNRRDLEYKEKIKKNRESTNTREHHFIVGDYVLLKQKKVNKWSTPFEAAFYIIFQVHGSSIGAKRVTDGREVYRDASHFKLANAIVKQGEDCRSDDDDERETLLRNVEEDKIDILESPQEIPQEMPCNRTVQDIDNSDFNQQVERPRRRRHIPGYLKDYVVG